MDGISRSDFMRTVGRAGLDHSAGARCVLLAPVRQVCALMRMALVVRRKPVFY
jgi:hypothetical protein